LFLEVQNNRVLFREAIKRLTADMFEVRCVGVDGNEIACSKAQQANFSENLLISTDV
jgi:hypothetical protein